MSNLMPGQKIQRLVTEGVRDAYDKGRESERKRIVKLIEKQLITLCKCDDCLQLNYLIELIKGDKNE